MYTKIDTFKQTLFCLINKHLHCITECIIFVTRMETMFYINGVAVLEGQTFYYVDHANQRILEIVATPMFSGYSGENCYITHEQAVDSLAVTAS